MSSCQLNDVKNVFEERKKISNQELLLPIQELITYLNQMILGQEALVQSLIVALLADGHLLVEGVPGLAKTRAIKVLATAIDAPFHRLQFTPDLLPADLIGTEIYRMETGKFEFQAGPLFHQLILADEINRAPAKVQSALLEAMAEKQITVGKQTYALPKLFLVMATQNPIEQEGTHPLPEAELDRFLLKVNVGYPDAKKEIEILNLVLNESRAKPVEKPFLSRKLKETEIFMAREAALDIYMAKNIQEYIVQLVVATRNPHLYGKDLADFVQFGASPRAIIGLARCAKVLSFLQGSEFVGPDHVQAMAPFVLGHRIVLSFAAMSAKVTPSILIDELISRVAVP